MFAVVVDGTSTKLAMGLRSSRFLGPQGKNRRESLIFAPAPRRSAIRKNAISSRTPTPFPGSYSTPNSSTESEPPTTSESLDYGYYILSKRFESPSPSPLTTPKISTISVPHSTVQDAQRSGTPPSAPRTVAKSVTFAPLPRTSSSNPSKRVLPIAPDEVWPGVKKKPPPLSTSISVMSRYLDEQSEYLMERNGTYGTYPGRAYATPAIEDNGPRGILRKPSDHYARPYQIPQTSSFASERSEASNACGLLMDGFVRPAVAELLSVFCALFVFLQVEAELSQRHVASVHRISILALVDAICATLFFATFKNVHLNPSLTVAQLFSLSTSWFVCGVLVLCQLAGAMLAVSAHQALRSPPELPEAISFNQEISTDESRDIVRTLVCQLIAAVIVVISHLLCCVSMTRRSGSFRIGYFKENPICMFFSVGLSSFINLLYSTQNWNPLLSLSIAFYRLIAGVPLPDAFSNLHLFWLAPIIGALLASFLFRVLFTNDDRRLFKCGDNEDAPSPC